MSINVAVLASHNGSNLRALTAAARQPGSAYAVALVISNNSASGALAHAVEQGIAHAHLSGRTHPDPDALDQAMLALLREHDVALVVTAGYMRKIGPAVLAAYEGALVNVHPALLPRHGGPGMYGRHVHEAVLADGDLVSGASVHLLTDHYDEGRVLAQAEVPVLPDDTPDTLAARVLEVEHRLLPATVQQLALARDGDATERGSGA
ncbi:phosphoribosylglycinamide formyltransferase [Streptacidiphilus jiangxiensis]|uniref:Phosphoribosylglycinamide formyltransferase n=1 Tax=Streptacidiphilus jiangxiensis TaxID=235985 RepID=A0A1H7UDX4_STRJI|nr:phosphoribosylglycinamide formyltransferase [Streptacidiphilus jiangxiensis]SEL94457.1 phosphoribosylglycinamide formyltransferase-1 [Streptacidiphilus jiangxiensis]